MFALRFLTDVTTGGARSDLYLFHRFYLAVALITGCITKEKRRKKRDTTVPVCHTEPFDSLKGWRDQFFWVNSSLAPMSMQWFDGKDFPRDYSVDGFDSDMTLETLLNDNPTRIRRHPKEFLILIGFSRMWHTPKARPVFYDEETKQGREEKLEENERPLIERTADVVTGGRSGVSKKPVTKKGHLVIKSPSSIPLESAIGSSHKATDDLASSEAGSGQLVVSKETAKATTSLSSTSTRSQPLLSVCSVSPSLPKSRNIMGIIISPVEDSAETPC
ncbi:hypothetical protein Tco_1164414 [Tanacetum coccineum]